VPVRFWRSRLGLGLRLELGLGLGFDMLRFVVDYKSLVWLVCIPYPNSNPKPKPKAGPLPSLESVHESEMGKDRHTDKSGNTLNKLQAIWNSNRCRIDNDFHENKGEIVPNFNRLDEVYQAFIR
jgi:hypothetical protein